MAYYRDYKYTNNYVSLYKNDLYKITIYKEKNCIDELKLSVPQIEFDSCYKQVQLKNKISFNLIILIVESYFNGSSLLFYSLYDPNSGKNLNIIEECKNEEIIIHPNIMSILESTNIDINTILKLTQQNINLFNREDSFYTDICFHYESPNGKDATLRDRIKEFFPNITLCNEGCLSIGVNLTSMSAICQCKFNDFINDQIFTRNAFTSKISKEIAEAYYQSNFILLKCYKDILKYQYFKKNLGGIMILVLISCQTICIIYYFLVTQIKINEYIFVLLEIYLSYLNKRFTFQDQNKIMKFINSREPPKKKKENKPKKIIYHNHMNIIKLNINNYNSNNKNFNSSKNLCKINNKSLAIFKDSKEKNYKKKKLLTCYNNKNNTNSKVFLINNSEKKFFRDSIENNKKEMIKINKYIEKYLSIDVNLMEYDLAIKLDKRTFFQFLWGRIKIYIFLFDIFLVHEPLKPIAIKILIFLIHMDIYFLFNGIFLNEEYISELYHTKEDSFIKFIKRNNYNLFYTIMSIIILKALINCLFVDEKKIKIIFKTEKNNKLNLKREIILILQNIKSRYTKLFIISYIISIFSWYYISCFNNTYPNTKIEWIKSSIFIILSIQIFLIFLSILETILRFLSFKCNSEKLFKISLVFSSI